MLFILFPGPLLRLLLLPGMPFPPVLTWLTDSFFKIPLGHHLLQETFPEAQTELRGPLCSWTPSATEASVLPTSSPLDGACSPVVLQSYSLGSLGLWAHS